MNLSEKTYWNVGGSCSSFFETNTESELHKVLTYNDISDLIVIGNGTNLLFDSEGYSGVVIKLGKSFNFINNRLSNNTVEVGASVWVPGLVRKLSTLGKGSLDHCVGIPATVGGLVAMNGGSQRRSISENIVSVKVMDFEGVISTIPVEKCLFSYRDSIFLKEKLIILSVVLKLEEIVPKSNRKNLLNILKERRLKFPRKEPNCGSVFKSSKELYDKVGPPGFIIESLGLKGLTIGNAQISSKHANFIVNKGGAHSRDIIKLVKYINKCCFEKYEFTMEAEAIYIESTGKRYLIHRAPDK